MLSEHARAEEEGQSECSGPLSFSFLTLLPPLRPLAGEFTEMEFSLVIRHPSDEEKKGLGLPGMDALGKR